VENYIDNAAIASAHIFCVGLGWFPKTPGDWIGMFMNLRHLAAGNDQVELYALGLPEAEPNSP